MAVMEGRDLEHIRGRFKDIYQPVLLANWKVWPAAQVSQLCVSYLGPLMTHGTVVHQF